MNVARLTRVALVVGTAALLSCGESPVSPVPPPQAGLVSSLLPGVTSLLQNVGLLACSPRPTATSSATIGPLGGVILVGPHTLSVPPGALAERVTITAVSPRDRVNRVQFQPEGLVFRTPAALTMSYANCNLLGSLAPKRIAYTDDKLTILEYVLSIDNLLTKKVTGKLDHFSNYAIAW